MNTRFLQLAMVALLASLVTGCKRNQARSDTRAVEAKAHLKTSEAGTPAKVSQDNAPAPAPAPAVAGAPKQQAPSQPASPTPAAPAAAPAPASPATLVDQNELEHAVSQRNADQVKALLAQGVDVNGRNKAGGTPLMQAAMITDQVPIIKMLLANGADVNARDNAGFTALIHACALGNSANAEALLAGGASANAATNKGSTSLMLAATIGHNETVRVLIAHKADLNLRNLNGHTALQLADMQRQGEAAKLLRIAGAAETLPPPDRPRAAGAPSPIPVEKVEALPVQPR